MRLTAIALIAIAFAHAVAAQELSTPDGQAPPRASWDFRPLATSFRSKQEVVQAATADPAFEAFSPASNPSTRRLASIEEDPAHAQFLDWAAALGFSFAPGEEEEKAFANWKENMAKVYKTNTDPKISWWLSGNQFTHLSFSEFRDRVLMKKKMPTPSLTASFPDGSRRLTEDPTVSADQDDHLQKIQELQAQIDASVRSEDYFVHLAAGQRIKRRSQRRLLQAGDGNSTASNATSDTSEDPNAIPSFVDWVEEGKVTFVKDQGQCGSCWSFVAVAALESMYLQMVVPDAPPEHIDLSEQQLLSCCTPASSGRGQCRTCSGCDGGIPYEALYYAAAGMELTERSYPYLASTYYYGANSRCNGTQLMSPDRVGVRSMGPPLAAYANNETALIAITSFSPTMVGFFASDDFQLYAGGVFQPKRRNCNGDVDHAMLVVGYDNRPDGPDGRYFKLKNSYGRTWGESGYIRVRMSGDSAGTCGMYNMNPVIPYPVFQTALDGDELPDFPPMPPPFPPFSPPPPPPPCIRRCIGPFCICRSPSN